MRIDAFCAETDWAKLGEAAARAERLGFDGFAVPEITGDPLQNLVAACLATQKIELRTAIAVAFPRSPMVTAGAAWSLHANSGGRFALGLGTQVKGHNERRFSTPWHPKAGTRLREYVEALRATWRCWEKGEKLDYQGEHYQLTLMTPEFSPPASGLPMVPVYLAAVRPTMLRIAGKVADGLRLHGFCTRRYLEEVALPEIQTGLEQAGRSRDELEICGGGFICTGPDEQTVQQQLEWVRYRVAFYGSTRSYSPVMELHGWGDLAKRLHRMSIKGQWTEMAQAVPDEVVREFAAVGTYDELPAEVERRFGGLSDVVELPAPDTDDEQLAAVVGKLRGIEARFRRHRDWYA